MSILDISTIIIISCYSCCCCIVHNIHTLNTLVARIEIMYVCSIIYWHSSLFGIDNREMVGWLDGQALVYDIQNNKNIWFTHTNRPNQTVTTAKCNLYLSIHLFEATEWYIGNVIRARAHIYLAYIMCQCNWSGRAGGSGCHWQTLSTDEWVWDGRLRMRVAARCTALKGWETWTRRQIMRSRMQCRTTGDVKCGTMRRFWGKYMDTHQPLCALLFDYFI